MEALRNYEGQQRLHNAVAELSGAAATTAAFDELVDGIPLPPTSPVGQKPEAKFQSAV